MKYQYATVSGSMKKNDQREFIIENDSLTIKYTFNGINCPVNISIFNKLDIPLYIDWKRSSLILNDENESYWNDVEGIKVTQRGHEIKWTPTVSTTQSTITGEITRDEPISFIPPHSIKQRKAIEVNPEFRLTEPKKSHRIKIPIENGTTTGLQYQYIKDNSPLCFRSFITLSTAPSFAQSFTHESEFWVDEIIQTSLTPKDYMKDKTKADKFYKSKLTSFGTFVGITAILVTTLILSLN